MSKRTYDKYLGKTFNGCKVLRYSISRLVISVARFLCTTFLRSVWSVLGEKSKQIGRTSYKSDQVHWSAI